ncbi:MAG: hypothetical protein MK085_12090, partial [Phycisphaerales bacterium]|nr:hypothetical protein [Phycisphaerales bacterium]
MKFPADRSLATLLILAFAGVSIGLASPSFGQSEEPAPPEEKAPSDDLQSLLQELESIQESSEPTETKSEEEST